MGGAVRRLGAAPALPIVSDEAFLEVQLPFEEDLPAPERGGGKSRDLVSSGRAWGDQAVAIVDPESSVNLPAGQVGESWVSGPSVAQGYWRRSQSTAESFGARIADRPGQAYLRTGDLGFLFEGDLFVTGRIKDLIILRGRNLYPQDIELAAERSHPALRAGCSAAFSIEQEGEERLVVVQEIDRRRQEEAEEARSAIRRAVAEDFEARAWEVAIVTAGSVPKTSSGKVQRRACRRRFLEGGLAAIFPRNPGGRPAATPLAPAPEVQPLAEPAAAQAFLRQQVARGLGLAPSAVDPAQPLSALGLDSLGAVELRNAIEESTGVVLPLAELLRGPTVEELRDVLLAELRGGGSREPLAAAATPVEEYPLSSGQKALWFLYRLAPASSAYVIAGAARVRGPMEIGELRRAVGALTQRHRALRTLFREKDGAPFQRVRADLAPTVAEIRLKAPRPADLRTRVEEEALRPFDLEAEAPLRVTVIEGCAEGLVLPGADDLFALHRFPFLIVG